MVGNVLQTSATYNGSQATYSVDVTSSDGTSSTTKTFTITRVQGANQAPTNIVLSNNSVPENSPVGFTVGTFTASDPNPNNTFTFDFATGAGSTDNGSFTFDGTSLKLAAIPNFENKSSYSIRVRVTDQGLLSFDKVFTINVSNVNEAPTNINLSNRSVAINAPAGTVVGNLSTVDPDAGNTHSYTLAAGSPFVIVGGSLRVGATALNGTTSSYSISITSTDQNGLAFTKPFTIETIAAPNTAPTDITVTPSTVLEGTASASFTLAAVDATPGITGPTFSKASGAGDADNGKFTIVDNILTLNETPNFEAKSAYSIRVRATDADGATFDKILTISVQNVNEAPTNINLSNRSVAINAPAGTVVGNLSTVDPDAGNTHSYTLAAGSPFVIVGGSLRVGATALNGTTSSYSISITSTDQNGLAFTKPFTIETIAAPNTAPTDITVTPSTVLEGTASASFTLAAVDATPGITGPTFSKASGAGDADNGKFTIVDNILTLNETPNFEAKSAYSIRVRATDANGATFDKILTISVQNVNEAPTNINLSNRSVAINAPAGTVVGNLSTVDPDAGNTHSYTLAAGSPFVIVGGSLRVGATALNGTTPSYSISITSTDQNGLTFTKTFTIETIAAPNTAPTNITLSSTNVQQNSAAGTVIGTLGAVDANQTTGFIFELTTSGAGSADNGTFHIVNGQLVLKNAIPSRATKSSYVIRIRVTDAGGLSFDKIFGINVTL